MIGLDPTVYGAFSIRCTIASVIYKSTENLLAVRLLLGHTKIARTVRYLGVEVNDALETRSILKSDSILAGLAFRVRLLSGQKREVNAPSFCM